MPGALWVTCYRSVRDPAKLAAYAALAGPALAAGGGSFLVRGSPTTAFEHGLLERTVIIQFPSVAAAVETYKGAAYAAALAALGDGAERDLRIVEMVA